MIIPIKNNQGPSNGRFRLAISDEGAGTAITQDEYIEYHTDIVPRSSYQRTNIKVRGGQSIVAWSDNPDVSFSVYAKFNYSVISTDFSVAGELITGGKVTAGGNIIGNANLSVSGTSTLSGNTTLGSLAVPATLTTYGTVTSKNSSDQSTITILPETGNIVTSGALSSNTLTTSGDITVGTNVAD